MPRLLILSYTHPRKDPRVLRQIQFLRQHYIVTVCGLSNPEIEGVDFFPIKRRKKNIATQSTLAVALLFGYYKYAQQRFCLVTPEHLVAKRFDLVLVNDLEPLPLGFTLAKGAPVVFDAHEYYPKEFEDSWKWRLFFQHYYVQLCKQYIPRCAAMTTVSFGIAEEYKAQYGLSPTVVYSGPPLQPLAPFPVAHEHIRMVHHGAANRDRGIECMIDAIRLLDDRFMLDFYLVGDRAYINQLKEYAADLPRIQWQEPVSMQELPSFLNKYDIGLYILQATGFNNIHALPNKFFEFIQARLAIAVGPSPEMASIVNEHQCGVVATDFSPQAMADALRDLTTDDITRFKHNTHVAASLFTAEQNMCTLHAVLQGVLKD